MTPFKHIRAQLLGMTQAELAARLGVQSLAVSRWESGARRVPHERIRPVLRALVEAAGHSWTDSLLFEVPVCDDCHSPGECGAICARLAGDGGGPGAALPSGMTGDFGEAA